MVSPKNIFNFDHFYVSLHTTKPPTHEPTAEVSYSQYARVMTCNCYRFPWDYIYGTWYRCRECGRWLTLIPPSDILPQVARYHDPQ